MKQTFMLPKIEIRSTLEKNGTPKYVVKGYAVAKNAVHPKGYVKDRNGNVTKSFKSYFTETFEREMFEQLKHKDVFVDALHTTVLNKSIENVLEDIQVRTGVDIKDDIESVKSFLKASDFPFAKVTDFKIDDKGLYVEAEINPYFREVDERHQKYYDAVLGSLQSGYINGMSINFQPTQVIQEGDLEKINKGELFGISFMGEAALGSNASITEVAIRTIQEFQENKQGERNMTENEPNKDLEAMKQQIAEQNRLIESMKQQQSEKEEAAKQAEIERQKKEQEERIKLLEKQVEEAKKTGKKGLVGGQEEPNQPLQGTEGSPVRTKEEFNEKLKSISWADYAQLQKDFDTVKHSVSDFGRSLLSKEKKDLVFEKN